MDSYSVGPCDTSKDAVGFKHSSGAISIQLMLSLLPNHQLAFVWHYLLLL